MDSCDDLGCRNAEGRQMGYFMLDFARLLLVLSFFIISFFFLSQKS